jgi:hypothetical protein
VKVEGDIWRYQKIQDWRYREDRGRLIVNNGRSRGDRYRDLGKSVGNTRRF